VFIDRRTKALYLLREQNQSPVLLEKEKPKRRKNFFTKSYFLDLSWTELLVIGNKQT